MAKSIYRAIGITIFVYRETKIKNKIVNVFCEDCTFLPTKCMYFQQFGEIDNVLVLTDKHNQQPKGLAYVRFKCPFSAVLAIESCDKCEYVRLAGH